METTDIALAGRTAELSAPVQSAALNVWRDKDAFDQTARVASMLAKSTIVPQNYQGKPEDCFIAVELASRMNTSPLFIMQNLYVVKGKPSWAGQACMAMIMSCGKFRNVKHVYTGAKGTDSRGCYVTAERISDGEVINGTEVTLAMAKSEGWTTNSKWKNMPEQMLGYRAASFFARMYCPEAMMGIQTTEEVIDADAGRNKAEEEIVCEGCGKVIEKSKSFSAKQIADMSMQRYGKKLCVECAKKAKAGGEAVERQEQKQDADGPEHEPEPESEEVLCSKCGSQLVGFGSMTPMALGDYTRKKYGAVMCARCAKAVADAETEKPDEPEKDEEKTEEQDG